MGFVVLDEDGLLPGACVEVDASTDPTAASRVWTDITPLVRSLSFQRSGRNQEINRSTAGSLTAVCGDAGGAITGLGLRKRQWVRVRAMPPGNGVLLQAGPSLFWRLGDPAGSSVAADSSGNDNTGVCGSGVALGQVGAIAGDPTTAGLFNNTGNAKVTAASYAPFVVGSKRTFMGWAYRTATSDFDSLFGSPEAAPNGAGLFIGSGSENVDWRVSGSGSNDAVWAAAWPGLNQWVHWALTYDDSTKTSELFINGVSQGTHTSTSGYTTPTKFVAGVFEGSPWIGEMQEVAVFEQILTPAAIQAIYQANTEGIPRWQGILDTIPRKWPGQGADQLGELHATDTFKILGLIDLTGQTFPEQRNDERVTAILNLAAGIAAGNIDTDTDTADPVTTPFPDSSMALDYLLQIEASEDGLLIANPDGTIDFQGRHWRFFNATTAAATFGENPANNEIPYLDDAELDDDDSVLFNVVGVTPYGASTAVATTNTASTAKYWPTRMDVQLLSSDAGLAQVASEWLSSRYGDPAPRIPAITVELAAASRINAALVATLLQANNSSRFTWKRNASTPIMEDVWVEQISETIDVAGGSWQWKAQLSPTFDRAMWVLGDPVFGALGETTALGY